MFFLHGCSSNEEEKFQKKKKNVVAQVEGKEIYLEDIKEYLSLAQNNYFIASESDIERRLDEMITAEVLYQEAMRLAIAQDPATRRSIVQILSQRLLEKQVYKPVMEREINEKELKAYYEKHHLEFNRPEMLKIADIFISKEDNAEAFKKAEKVFQEAMASKNNRSGFGQLVGEYSDIHSSLSQGISEFFDAGGQPAGVHPDVAKAAFQIARVGNLFEKVIETPDGFHVIMLVGKRSAAVREFDDVQAEIEKRIRKEEREHGRDKYIETLLGKVEINKNSEVLEQLLVELKKTPAKAPPVRVPVGRVGSAPPHFPSEK